MPGCQTDLPRAQWSGHMIPNKRETPGQRREFPKRRETMQWDAQKVLLNIRQADTDDLLDRITAYRRGMEPDAIVMIERELRERNVSAAEIAEHREICERDCIYLEDGTAAKCSFCQKPAVAEGRGWWKIYRLVPFFPRRLRYCGRHRPESS